MITVTYEYVCDVCGKPICATETYNIGPFILAQHPAFPMPRFKNQVGSVHVCDSCMADAMAPLKATARMRTRAAP